MEGAMRLPVLADGVAMIGDLWDSRSSKRVGFNLFGSNLMGEPMKKILTAETIDSLEASLKHKKDIKDTANNLSVGAEVTAELLGGMIKITGGLDFELGWSNGMSEEEIQMSIVRYTEQVQLGAHDMAEYREHMDPFVVRLIKSGKLESATHVVRRVDFGGSMLASLKLSQKNKGTNYKIGVFIEGVLDLKLISAKLEANASVGEDIVTVNYGSTIKLKSMPPIDAPTKLEDFYMPLNTMETKTVVSELFMEALERQNHFEIWDSLLGDTHKITGIPTYFLLVPISSIFDETLPTPVPEPDTPKPETPEEGIPEPIITPPKLITQIDEEKKNGSSTVLDSELLFHKLSFVRSNFEEKPRFSQATELPATISDAEQVLDDFSKCTSKLYMWRGADYIKRQLLGMTPRIQKILSEDGHSIVICIADRTTNLNFEADELKINILDDFEEYKENGNLEMLATAVSTLKAECDDKTDQTNTFVSEINEDAIREINAVNIGINDDEEEDTSPLIYFTNVADIKSWIGTSRHSKVLYYATLNPPHPSFSQIPQRLYNMSRRLGSVNIQPAIAYPTLTTQRAKKSSVSLQIASKSTVLLYNFDQHSEIKLVLDILDDCTGAPEEKERTDVAIHLYNSICELEGVKPVFAVDEIAELVDFLQTTLESVILCRNVIETKRTIEESDETVKIILTSDGVKSSIPVIKTLQILQNRAIYGAVVCGTFNIQISDTPLFFLAQKTKIYGVCLDHLDLMILLNYDSSTIIPDLLTMTKFEEFPLCPTGRIAFAREVKIGAIKGPSQPINLAISTGDILLVAKISESVLNARIQTVKPLINWLTAYTLSRLGDIYTNHDEKLSGWNSTNSTFAHNLSDSEEWSEVLLNVDGLSDSNEKGFPYYASILKNQQAFSSATMPPEIPNTDPGIPDPPPDEPPEKPEEPPTREQLDTAVHEFISSNDSWISETLRSNASHITEVTLPYLHLRALAKIYEALLTHETWLEQIINNNGHLYRIKQLHRAIDEVVGNATVSQARMHASMTYALDDVQTQLNPIIYQGILANLRMKRYYNLVSTLTENSPSEYQNDNKDLVVLQNEILKLSSIKDWYQLTIIINRMDTEGSFSLQTQQYVWSNEKFQYLIWTNLSNTFVLELLRKNYVANGSVPTYIPQHIAKVLLAGGDGPIDGIIEDEWEDIVIPESWESKHVMIRVFQRIAITQKMPKSFQKILFLNVIKIEDSTIVDYLREGNCLFYWNEDKQYFTEQWDLLSIEQAITSLLVNASDGQFKSSLTSPLTNSVITQNPNISASQQNVPQSKNFANLLKPIPIELKGNDKQNVTPNVSRPTLTSSELRSKELISIISSVTIHEAKRSLILHNNLEPLTVENFYQYWTSGSLYPQLIVKTREILTSENWEQETIQLRHLLCDLSKVSIAKSNKAFANLSAQSDQSWEKDYPLIEKRNLLCRFKNETYKNQLLVPDLLTEFCRAATLSPDLVGINPHQITEIMSKYILAGYEFEIPISMLDKTYFGEEWMTRILDDVTSPDERYFVINCVGLDESKMYVLFKSIFAKDDRAWASFEGMIITDLQFRLHQFDPLLQKQTGVCGILLVFSRSICNQEKYGHVNYHEYDQKLTTFLLSSSNLTIIHDYDKSNEVFSSMLETCLFDMSRTGSALIANTTPNLIFVGGEREEIITFLQATQKNFSSFTNYGDNSLLCNKTALHALSSASRGMGHFKEDEDVESLYSIITQHVQEQKSLCPTFLQFTEIIKQGWRQIETTIPFPFKNYESMITANDLGLKIDLVSNAIDYSFATHTDNLSHLIYSGLLSIFVHDDDLPYQMRKELLLTELSKRIKLIFKTCNLNMANKSGEERGVRFKSVNHWWKSGLTMTSPREGPEICKACSRKVTLEESTLAQIGNSDQKLEFLSKIRKYEESETKHFLNMLRQMLDSQEIIMSRREDKEPELKAMTDIQTISFSRVVIPSVRRISYEIGGSFPMTVHNWGTQSEYESIKQVASNVPAYDGLLTFDLSDVHLEDEFLTWEEATWLGLYVSTTINNVVKGKDIYQSGMVRLLKSNMETVFHNFSIRFAKVLLSPFKSAVMNFCLKEFTKLAQSKETTWNKEYEPVTVLENLDSRFARAR